MPGSLTTPGRPGARDDAPRRIAFHDLHGVGTQNRNLSRLNAPRTLLRFIATTDPAATLSSSIDFPV